MERWWWWWQEGGTLFPLGLSAGARWPSLSLGDLWEGHYEVWVAVTLTACDSTTPGTAVPACASQRPRAHGEGGGTEAASEKTQGRVECLESVWGGAGGYEQREKVGEAVLGLCSSWCNDTSIDSGMALQLYDTAASALGLEATGQQGDVVEV